MALGIIAANWNKAHGQEASTGASFTEGELVLNIETAGVDSVWVLVAPTRSGTPIAAGYFVFRGDVLSFEISYYNIREAGDDDAAKGDDLFAYYAGVIPSLAAVCMKLSEPAP